MKDKDMSTGNFDQLRQNVIVDDENSNRKHKLSRLAQYHSFSKIKEKQSRFVSGN